jgi:ribose transport system substrate-binding protein
MQFPKVIAAKAAEMADLYLKGEGDFPKKLPVEVELVNQENIERYSAYGKNK